MVIKGINEYGYLCTSGLTKVAQDQSSEGVLAVSPADLDMFPAVFFSDFFEILQDDLYELLNENYSSTYDISVWNQEQSFLPPEISDEVLELKEQAILVLQDRMTALYSLVEPILLENLQNVDELISVLLSYDTSMSLLYMKKLINALIPELPWDSYYEVEILAVLKWWLLNNGFIRG